MQHPPSAYLQLNTLAFAFLPATEASVPGLDDGGCRLQRLLLIPLLLFLHSSDIKDASNASHKTVVDINKKRNTLLHPNRRKGCLQQHSLRHHRDVSVSLHIFCFPFSLCLYRKMRLVGVTSCLRPQQDLLWSSVPCTALGLCHPSGPLKPKNTHFRPIHAACADLFVGQIGTRITPNRLKMPVGATQAVPVRLHNMEYVGENGLSKSCQFLHMSTRF